MKSFFKISLIVFSVLSASIAQADDMELLVKVAKENSKWVSFITSDSQKINLTLSTSAEEVIFEENTKTVSNRFKTYDLSALPQGMYTLKMESPTKITTYQINITGENALLSQPVVTEIKKPIFVKKENILTLDLNGTCDGEVEVLIYNEYNEKLHEDIYRNENKVTKKYDVSKTLSKELTFVIKSRNQEFTEIIKL